MPTKSANVKNKKQYEALKEKGMSKERAAKIANSPRASSHGGKKSGSGGNRRQGGTTAQHKAAGRRTGPGHARTATSSFRVTRRRGEFFTLPSGAEATATIHPSAVLRAENRENAFAGLVDDLRAVAKRLESSKEVRKA
jgi:hypothetical protein